jgi:hypothetical protein
MLFKRETMYIPVMPYDIIPYIEVNTGLAHFHSQKAYLCHASHAAPSGQETPQTPQLIK